MTKLMMNLWPYCGILDCFTKNWVYLLVSKPMGILKNMDFVPPIGTSYWYRFLTSFPDFR